MNKQKAILIKCCVVEVILLVLILVAGVLINRRREAIPIPIDQWTSDYTTPVEGKLTITEDDITNSKEQILYDLDDYAELTDGEYVAFCSPKKNVPAGDYTLILNYSTNAMQYGGISVDEGCEGWINTGRIRFSINENVLLYHFTVKHEVNGLRVEIYNTGEGIMTLTDASLTPNSNGIKRLLICVLMISVLFNLLVINREKIKEDRFEILILSFAIIFSSIPVFSQGIIYGHDLMFHLNRIEGISQAIQLHQLPVRHYPNVMDGYGYPLPIYYGDLLLYFPALLRLMGFSVTFAYKAYIVFINSFTGIIAYVCFNKMLKNKRVASVVSATFLLSYYRLVDIYARSSVGEYTAMMFLPLIAMALYQIYTGDDDSTKEYVLNASYLALGMTGVICTHILTTEMVVIIMVMVALILGKYTFKWKTLRVYLLAAGGTLLLSAFYIVPFLYHYLFVPTIINSDSALDSYFSSIQWGGAYINQFFNVFAYPFGFNSENVYERMALTPGLVLMVALFAAVALWVKGNLGKRGKYLVVFSVLSLWMSSNLFPWDFLSIHVSRFFSFVQMPWRYLSMAIVFLSMLFGELLLVERSEQRRKQMIVVSLLCLVFSGLVFTRDALSYDFTSSFEDTAELDSVKNMSFMCLRDGTIDSFPQGLASSQGMDSYEVITHSGEQTVLNVSTTSGGYAEAPKLNYPGYVALDDQGNDLQITDGDNNIVRVIVPEGYSGNITIRFKEPWIWRVSELVSLVSAIILYVYWKRANTSSVSKLKAV